MESTTTIDALSEDLLCLIFSVGGLSAKDIASASMTCRDWRRACASERIWQAVWREHAGALAGTEADVAARGGDSFRRAVSQLLTAVRVARSPMEPDHGDIEKYTFVMDISYEGQRIFSTLQKLSAGRFRTIHGEWGKTRLTFDNQLSWDDDGAVERLESAAESLHEAYAAAIRGADSWADRCERMAEVTASLKLRLIILRSDGALACVLNDAPCSSLDEHDKHGFFPTWSSNLCNLTKLFAFRRPGDSVDTHRISFHIHLIPSTHDSDVEDSLEGERDEGGAAGGAAAAAEGEEEEEEHKDLPFPCALLVFKENFGEFSEPVPPEQLVVAMESLLNWVPA